MKIKVMARERRGGEMPEHFKSFRRAGIEFPSFSAGMVHGGPVEVTVVAEGERAFADAMEVDQDGLAQLLAEERLIVEDSADVQKAREALVVAAKEKREKFVGARLVKKGGFESFAPDMVDVAEAQQDELEKTSLAELRDTAENMKIADARKLNKGELIHAIRLKEDGA